MGRFLILSLAVVLTACSSTKNKLSIEEMNALETLVSNGNVSFEANWAYPRVTNSLVQISNAGLLMPNSNAARIDLIGNTNYITFMNDSIQTYLPFFGERQITNGYGTQSSGIVFDGIPEELTIKPNKKHTSLQVEFTGVDGTESYRVVMNIFPNKTANVFVTSSHRFSIGYSGVIKEIPTSEEVTNTVFN